MSRDSDLIVSCRCGKIEIAKIDGYLTSDLVDAAELGRKAEELCRRKRIRSFSRVTMGICAGLVLLCGAWWGVSASMRNSEALALCRRGETFLNKRDPVSAIGEFTKSLKVKPEPRTYLYRGFAYYQLGAYHEAIKDCESALVLDPSNEAAKKSLHIANYALDSRDDESTHLSLRR